jgi:hypothetical protein
MHPVESPFVSDAALLDLGLLFRQLAADGRGFRFQTEAPLAHLRVVAVRMRCTLFWVGPRRFVVTSMVSPWLFPSVVPIM